MLSSLVRRTPSDGRGYGPAGRAQVDLIRVMDLLQRHITPALCQTVFQRVRNSGRQRVWTVHALVQFWTAVILRAPQALSQALADGVADREPLFPRVEASSEALSQRCRDLRPAFFAAVFGAFTARLVAEVPARYADPLGPVQARCAAIVLIDGSRLAVIARRLKLLCHERAVILPGALLARYGVGRGLCQALYFTADAAASAMPRAKAAVAALAPDTLLVGDRLYGAGDFFATLRAGGCWGLVRRNRLVRLRKQQRLRKRRHAGGVLEDWVGQAGTGVWAPAQTLRYLRWRRGGTRYELLTKVLEPARLSAIEALALYPTRWSIERIYFDLKEVLNLNRVYAANPNAVAMQVYAAGLVYNALRVAQGGIVAAAGIAPEEISPAKFYPKVAAVCHAYLVTQLTVHDIRRLNPRRRLRIPDWRRARWASVPLAAIRVEPRRGGRRHRRFCAARRTWKSFAHVVGCRKFTRLS